MSASKLSNAELAKILGYASQEKISRLFRKESEGAKPSFDIIYDLSNSFENLNISWLITGTGTMFKNKNENAYPNAYLNAYLIDKKEHNPDQHFQLTGSKRNNVLLVPVKVQAGYMAGYGDPEYVEHLEHYVIPGCTHGDYRMFEVAGESMYPTLSPGDYVVGRAVEDCHSIKKDTIYIIVSPREGIIVKRVLNAQKTPDKLELYSDNPAFKTTILDCADIAEVWEFYMLLTTLPGAQDPAAVRLKNLEYEVEEIKRLIKKK